jgi:hypothetical protein
MFVKSAPPPPAVDVIVEKTELAPAVGVELVPVPPAPIVTV